MKVIMMAYAASIRARISSTRHAVMRSPSFRTGCGNRPDFTPAHQVDLETGISGGIGGLAVGSPIICLRRRKPVAGRWFILDVSVPLRPLLADGDILRWGIRFVKAVSDGSRTSSVAHRTVSGGDRLWSELESLVFCVIENPVSNGAGFIWLGPGIR